MMWSYAPLRVATLVVAGVLLCHQNLRANPVGETIASGHATFKRYGSNLIITQGSDRMIVNWKSFSIGKNELTKFIQPGAGSSALNRVIGGTRSLIDGRLEANGQVILVNPAGITVGREGVVNVNSFIGSTQDITDGDFVAGGPLKFSGQSEADIVNLGTIEAQTGSVILVAKRIVNEGAIVASEGTVGLAAADEVLVQPDAAEKLYISSKSGSRNGSIEHKGTIKAVAAEIKAAGNPYALAINLDGVIEARGVSGQGGAIQVDAGEGNVNVGPAARLSVRTTAGDGGKITLQKGSADQVKGDVTIAGTLDAEGADGLGGNVEVYGRRITLSDTALINAAGKNGGGVVRIGGGREGLDASVRNSEGVFIAEGAQVNASATAAGRGGEIIIYSSKSTLVYGSLIASGAGDGMGGFIETSGGYLEIGEHVPNAGSGGEWLVDPFSISIQDGGSNSGVSGGPNWTTTSGVSVLTTASILAALNAGTSVTITTSNALSGGDIAILSPIAKTLGGDASLTLNALRDIYIFDSITSTSGALSLSFNPDTNSDGQGSIILQDRRTTGNAQAIIDTNGGSIEFNGNMAAIGRLSGGSGSAQLLIDATRADLTGGDIYFGGEFFVANPNADAALNGIRIQAGSNARTTFASLVDSGNYYELVSGAYTFGGALADAKSGAGGSIGDTYLATITSSLEASVVGAASGYVLAWLGGSDETTEGVWRWVAGPEGLEDGGLGRIFFTGNRGGSATPLSGYEGYDGAYVNWNAYEPNDWGGIGEDGLILGWGGQGLWNDFPVDGYPNPYVKETNLAASSITISGGDVSFLGDIGRNIKLADLTLNNTGEVVFGPGVSSVKLENNMSVGAGATPGDKVVIQSSLLTVEAGGAVTILRQVGDASSDGTLAGLVLDASDVNIGADGVDASFKLKDVEVRTGGLSVKNSTINASNTLKLFLERQPVFDASSSLSGLNGSAADGSLQVRPRDGANELGIGDQSQPAAGGLLLPTSFINDVITGNFAKVIFGGGGMAGAVNVAGSSPLDLKTHTVVQTAASVKMGVSGISGSAFTITSGLELLVDAGRDVVLDGEVSIDSLSVGYRLVFSAAEAFINNFGASAISATGGSWIIYSLDPADNTFGGLVSDSLPTWGQSLSTLPPSGVPPGNHYIFASTPSSTLIASSLDQTKQEGEVVDFDNPVEGSAYSITGFIDASLYGGVWVQETAANSLSGQPVLSSAGAAASAGLGDYAITITAGSLVAPSGYTIGFLSAGNLAVVPPAPAPAPQNSSTSASVGDALSARPLPVQSASIGSRIRVQAERLLQPPGDDLLSMSDSGAGMPDASAAGEASDITLPRGFVVESALASLTAGGLEEPAVTQPSMDAPGSVSQGVETHSAPVDSASAGESENAAAAMASTAAAGSPSDVADSAGSEAAPLSDAAASTGLGGGESSDSGPAGSGPGFHSNSGSFPETGSLLSRSAKRSQNYSSNPENSPAIAALAPLRDFMVVFIFVIVVTMSQLGVPVLRPK